MNTLILFVLLFGTLVESQDSQKGYDDETYYGKGSNNFNVEIKEKISKFAKCRSLCKNDKGCQSLAFNKNRKSCWLKKKKTPKIGSLVIGGYYSGTLTEFFDFSNQKKYDCTNLPIMPKEVKEPKALYHDGSIIICGAKSDINPGRDCNVLNLETRIWTAHNNLFPSSVDPASSATFLPGIGWWFVGATLKSYILNPDSLTVVNGPSFDQIMKYNCPIQLNETKVVFTHGHRALLYDWSISSFTDLPSLNKNYLRQSCGFYKFNWLVVAGEEYDIGKSTEIYDFNSGMNNAWQTKGNLPKKILAAKIFQDKEGELYLIGGSEHDGINYYDTIYQLSNSFEWTKLSIKLEKARDFFDIIQVPVDKFNCN